jgi:hypothetical protein
VQRGHRALIVGSDNSQYISRTSAFISAFRYERSRLVKRVVTRKHGSDLCARRHVRDICQAAVHGIEIVRNKCLESWSFSILLAALTFSYCPRAITTYASRRRGSGSKYGGLSSADYFASAENESGSDRPEPSHSRSGSGAAAGSAASASAPARKPMPSLSSTDYFAGNADAGSKPKATTPSAGSEHRGSGSSIASSGALPRAAAPSPTAAASRPQPVKRKEKEDEVDLFASVGLDGPTEAAVLAVSAGSTVSRPPAPRPAAKTAATATKARVSVLAASDAPEFVDDFSNLSISATAASPKAAAAAASIAARTTPAASQRPAVSSPQIAADSWPSDSW